MRSLYTINHELRFCYLTPSYLWMWAKDTNLFVQSETLAITTLPMHSY